MGANGAKIHALNKNREDMSSFDYHYDMATTATSLATAITGFIGWASVALGLTGIGAKAGVILRAISFGVMGINAIVKNIKQHFQPVELEGGEGDDKLTGNDKDNKISGHGGDDIIKAKDGNDFVSGGSGNDIIMGGSGNDHLQGNEGDDKLYGQTGDDLVDGGPGEDTASGGAGADLVIGGAGDDSGLHLPHAEDRRAYKKRLDKKIKLKGRLEGDLDDLRDEDNPHKITFVTHVGNMTVAEAITLHEKWIASLTAEIADMRLRYEPEKLKEEKENQKEYFELKLSLFKQITGQDPEMKHEMVNPEGAGEMTYAEAINL